MNSIKGYVGHLVGKRNRFNTRFIVGVAPQKCNNPTTKIQLVVWGGACHGTPAPRLGWVWTMLRGMVVQAPKQCFRPTETKLDTLPRARAMVALVKVVCRHRVRVKYLSTQVPPAKGSRLFYLTPLVSFVPSP